MIRIIKSRYGHPIILVLKSEYKDLKAFMEWKEKYWKIMKLYLNISKDDTSNNK